MLLSYYTCDENAKLVKLPSLYDATPKFYIDMPDGEKAPVFDFKAFPFEIFANAPTYAKRGNSRDQINYINLACTFDIETTTIENVKKPFAFMYQWQYCIEDYVFMGKTWEEFLEFNEILTKTFNIKIYEEYDFKNGKPITLIKGKSLVCYIFNLKYEMMFMQHFIGELINPLFTDIYEPLYVPTKSGITYRCAYRLSNKSLDQFTKGMPHHKLAGDLDYSIQRTPVFDDPKNGLTDLELAYCYNDVKGCSEKLRDMFERETRYNIASIPLTATGFVRKDCRRSAQTDPKWHTNFINAKLTPELYEICRAAFRGGNTHSNAAFTTKLCGLPELGGIGGLIRHKDITSSYPRQMLTQKIYPTSPFIKMVNPNKIIEKICDKTYKLNEKYNNYCLLITMRLIGIKYRGSYGVPYIAKSKTWIRTQDKNIIKIDNGRIYSAPFVQFSCVDLDANIILRDYDIDRIEVISCYTSHKGMLPEKLRNTIFEYYKIKCELSGSKDPDDQYNRARAKENLNACYGMCCQRLDHLDIVYDHGKYSIQHRPLKNMIDEYYSSESSFLWYQWALWTTAGARAALDKGCMICGKDLIYIDTDSVFYIGDHEKEFEALNSEIEAESYKYGAVASNSKGTSYPIGVWTSEPDIKLFKTLGAKKYLLSEDGTTIQSTIAGVNKEIGQQYFTEHGWDAFDDSTIIHVSGKLSAHYNNDLPHYVTVNGIRILTASNVALINAPYTVKIKHDYVDFIKMIHDNLKNTYEGG